MDLNSKLVALAATAAFALAGCSAPQSAAPTPSAPSLSTQAARTPIDGDWLSRLTREQITNQLKQAGLRKWTKQFLKDQDIVKLTIAVYTFDEGRFAVAYLNEHDGTWKVGWKGPYSVAGDQVTMTDEFSGVTDVYRWEVSDAGLDLDRIGSDSDTVEGFPYQVFDAAYLSDTWTPTDCPMETDKSC
jgi:opacity protein-like surface antigen